MQRQLENERVRIESRAIGAPEAWAELVQRSLPPADAAPEQQAAALRDWSQRLRLPMALDDAHGRRIARRRCLPAPRSGHRRAAGMAVRLDDGRTLWVMRPMPRYGPGVPRSAAADGERPQGGERGPRAGDGRWPALLMPPQWPPGVGLLALLALLFAAVALGAYPVVRRLTRRLESLQRGVERFGAGSLGQRVDESGRDEVAAVARSFNQAAERIETLVRSHQSPAGQCQPRAALAAGAHEDGAWRCCRRPKARSATRLRREIEANIAELDALVEEVLLASRLDADAWKLKREPVELLGLAAEEAARVDAQVSGEPMHACRATNACCAAPCATCSRTRAATAPATIDAIVERDGRCGAAARVRPRARRARGLSRAHLRGVLPPARAMPSAKAASASGLSLVKQIAERHGGSVRCERARRRRQLLRAHAAGLSRALTRLRFRQRACPLRCTHSRNASARRRRSAGRPSTRPRSRARRATPPAPCRPTSKAST